MKLLRGFLFYLVTFAGIAVVGSPVILVSIISRKPHYPFIWVVWFYTYIFALFGIRVQVEGRENLNSEQAHLVLSNHQSFIDIPIILTHVKLVSFVAKKEIQYWPLFGGSMRRMHCIFVNRDDPQSRKAVGPQMQQGILKRVSYCVFPEGTRTPDGSLLPFKKGVFRIAMEAQITVLPVTISGTHRILPKNSFRMVSGTVRCVVHKPVNPADFNSAEDLMSHVRSIIAESL
jgi:1-acyl-sn-glycerol-3-phosphate acyltransferase